MPKRPAEVLTENAHGPDGQRRFRGQAPAPEWHSKEQAWFLDDLRKAGRLVAGEEDLDEARRTAGVLWPWEDQLVSQDYVELEATGERGRAGGAS